MKEKKVKIDFLKYVYENNGEFKNIETNKILLKHFKNSQSERLEMRRFLKFLAEDNLITIESNKGITFSTSNKRRIPREEISAIVRLKPKAVEFLKEHDKNIKHNFSFVFNIVLGFSSFILGWNNYILNNDNKALKKNNDSLIKANYVLSKKNISLKDSLNHFKIEKIKKGEK